MTKFIMFILVMGMVSCSVNKMSRDKLEVPPEMESIPIETKSAQVVTSSASKVYVEEHSKQVIVVSPTSGKKNLLYKAFLMPQDKLFVELVTFVYLPKKPTSEHEKKLYNLICENWVDSILSEEELKPNHDDKTEVMVPFFWPLKTKISKESCDKMIDQYDYARANQLMRKQDLNTKKVQFVSLYQNVHVTMDISSLVESEDINKAFQAWASYMTKTPEKNDSVYIFTMIDSLKKVLGALESLVVTKNKG